MNCVPSKVSDKPGHQSHIRFFALSGKLNSLPASGKADLCKQSVPRSGPTECWLCSGFKMDAV